MYNTIEDFEKGDIVFWAAKNATSKWRVKFGVIDFLSDCGARGCKESTLYSC